MNTIRNACLFFLLFLVAEGLTQNLDSLYFSTASATDLQLKADSLSKIKNKTAKLAKEGNLVVSKENANLSHQLSNVYYHLASTYRKEHQFSEAIIYYNKALDLDNLEELFKAKVLNDIGACYAEIGLYQQTFQYLLVSYNIKKQHTDFKASVATLTNLAHIQDILGYTEDAYNSYQELLKEIPAHNVDGEMDRHLAMVCYNFGNLLVKTDSVQLSDSLYNTALHIFSARNNLFEQAATHNAIAGNHAKRKEYQLAFLNYKKSINIFEQIGNKRAKSGIIHSKIEVVKLFLASKNYKLSSLYVEEILNNLSDLDNLETKKNAYNTLSDYYSANHQYQKAYQFHKKLLALNDSTHNQALISKTTQLKVLFDVEKMENEKKMLLEDNKIKAANYLQQQKMFRYLILASSLIFVLFIISTLMYIQKNKVTKYLVKKNIELSYSRENTPNGKLRIDSKKQENKYANSSLSEDKKVQLNDSINKRFFKEEAFLNPDFTLNSFAKELKTNRNYISQVINERYDVNFSTFINEQRIKKAIQLLSDKKNHIYTIDSIANMVGFNSKSSFNTAFKKQTGITPSSFIKSIKESSTTLS